MCDEAPACWICLGEGTSEHPLISPCRCPRVSHQGCLSRWQLSRVGGPEETQCRFCLSVLPPWRSAHAELPKSVPIMTVVHNNEQYQISVPDGDRRVFEAEIRRIFKLGEHEQLALSFGCKAPDGAELTLEGWESWDAAVHLASLSAGRRVASASGSRTNSGACTPFSCGVM